MPPYHVHFREEMQELIKLLLMWYNAEREPPVQYLQAGQRVFRSCMGGLRGHVSIEEHHVFPELQSAHPGTYVQLDPLTNHALPLFPEVIDGA